MPINFQEFWRNPDGKQLEDGGLKSITRPEFFINLKGVTAMVTTTMLKYLHLDASIIELGCGTGRNLAGLKEVGFTNLFGVEINQHAIDLGRKSFPALEGIEILCGAIEDVINDLPEADCYFTQGVLMHLPPTSDWIHEVISRKARKLIMTSENEDHGYNIAWARDYGKIFQKLGWIELEREKCGKWGDLPDTTIRHVLKKEQVIDESPDPQLPGQSDPVDESPPIKRSTDSKRTRKHTSD
jgi:SAM-dependent methyltransferase